MVREMVAAALGARLQAAESNGRREVFAQAPLQRTLRRCLGLRAFSHTTIFYDRTFPTATEASLVPPPVNTPPY